MNENLEKLLASTANSKRVFDEALERLQRADALDQEIQAVNDPNRQSEFANLFRALSNHEKAVALCLPMMTMGLDYNGLMLASELSEGDFAAALEELREKNVITFSGDHPQALTIINRAFVQYLGHQMMRGGR